jgi:lysosomal acid lipase/cholesteryl ester hydrolase
MGIYDVPAEIEYITSLKNDSLIYIGHSMGTTIFYVMASERPDIASKVKAMFGFAPVAFTGNIRGLFYPLGVLLGNLQV